MGKNVKFDGLNKIIYKLLLEDSQKLGKHMRQWRSYAEVWKPRFFTSF